MPSLLSCIPLSNAEPFALYLTWDADPLTTMTIRWVDNFDSSPPIFYRKKEDKNWLESKSDSKKLHTPLNKQVHWCFLENLNPETEYEFFIEGYSNKHLFQTAPKSLDKEISIVVGGDCYKSDEPEDFLRTLRAALKTDPLFITWGGDLAYGVDKHTLLSDKELRWLEFIHIYSKQLTKHKRLVPLFPCIGNHDVTGRYGQTPTQAQSFYALFLHPFNNTYKTLFFGSYLQVSRFDTNHTQSINRQVKQYILEQENRLEPLHKLAIYHIPIYPSIKPPDNFKTVHVKKELGPLLDEYNFHAAFEHHDHAYKRSWPLKKGEINSKGTIYIGDGAWGVNPRLPRCDKETFWYIAQRAAKRHFICVRLKLDMRIFEAISPQGELIDQYISEVKTTF